MSLASVIVVEHGMHLSSVVSLPNVATHGDTIISRSSTGSSSRALTLIQTLSQALYIWLVYRAATMLITPLLLSLV